MFALLAKDLSSVTDGLSQIISTGSRFVGVAWLLLRIRWLMISSDELKNGKLTLRN